MEAVVRRCSVKGVWCLSPATLMEKRLWHRCFPVNFAKVLRISIVGYRSAMAHGVFGTNSSFRV